MPHASSFGIQVEVGVHCVAKLLEDKPSRGGRIVMSTFSLASEFEGLAYYCDPRRLIIVNKGYFEALIWLERVLFYPQFSKLQVGLQLAQIRLFLGLDLCTYYLW